MLKKVLNFIFPKGYSCLCCKRDIFDNPYCFCDKCLPYLPHLDGRVCLHCNEPLISDGLYCKRCKGKKFFSDRAISPFKYEGVIKTLVLTLKEHKTAYIANGLAKFMAELFNKSRLYADIIIPVPLCSKRIKQRGFNQALILAEEVSRLLNIPLKSEILIRVKETEDQKILNFEQRQINLINAFKVTNSKCVKDKAVLLIDDIYTTGATSSECARMLKRAGAKCVYTLTAAHTVIADLILQEGEL